MIVQQLKLSSFMNHGTTTVTLPASGVVVVTGRNGSGKSALAEAVAWGAWGKTLRGASPVPPQGEKNIQVGVVTPDRTITRVRKAGRVTWSDTKYETNTKAQRALEEVIGDFETWRRTHHFSADSVSFARGTDTERKRLLERLLGIQHYDTAHKMCREDLRDSRATLTELRYSVEVAETRLGGLADRIRDAQDAIASFSDSDPVDQVRCDTISRQMADLRRRRAEVMEEVAAARTDLARAEADASQARQSLSRVSAEHCPVCDQSIPQSLLRRLDAEISEAMVRVSASRTEAAERAAVVAADESHYRESLELLRAEQAQLFAAKAAAENSRAGQQRLTDTVSRLTTDIVRAEDDLEELLIDADDAKHRTDVLVAANTVLGTRGFRAQVLGEALSGLEHAANNVLDHLTGGELRIQLAAHTTGQKGRVTDAISLGVVGAGGLHGYRACSTGQRRRIDVAIVLALAKLSGARGTLWFDEVFDGLDSEGVDRLAALLGDLAVDRAVVVVTHSREFGRRVSAASRWEVADGVVR